MTCVRATLTLCLFLVLGVGHAYAQNASDEASIRAIIAARAAAWNAGNATA